jgi:hypothetical protein
MTLRLALLHTFLEVVLRHEGCLKSRNSETRNSTIAVAGFAANHLSDKGFRFGAASLLVANRLLSAHVR